VVIEAGLAGPAAIVFAAPAGQRKLISMGRTNTNSGAHVIKTISRVGIDNITKTDDPIEQTKWVAALSTVKNVEILEKIPDDIEIIDGQAHLKGGGDVVI